MKPVFMKNVHIDMHIDTKFANIEMREIKDFLITESTTQYPSEEND